VRALDALTRGHPAIAAVICGSLVPPPWRIFQARRCSSTGLNRERRSAAA